MHVNPDPIGMFIHPGKTERFTLPTDTQTLSDYQTNPPAFLSDQRPGHSSWG